MHGDDDAEFDGFGHVRIGPFAPLFGGSALLLR
jgi:hypothetical protein